MSKLKEFDDLIRGVPASKLITINDVHAALAIKHKAITRLLITTGVFAWKA